MAGASEAERLEQGSDKTDYQDANQEDDGPQ